MTVILQTYNEKAFLIACDIFITIDLSVVKLGNTVFDNYLRITTVLRILFFLFFTLSASGHGLGPIKRLWQYLVRQESVQKIFVKYIFGRKPKSTSGPIQMNVQAESSGAEFASHDDHYMLQQMAR